MLNYVLYVNGNCVNNRKKKRKKRKKKEKKRKKLKEKKMKCKKLPGTNCGVVKLILLTILAIIAINYCIFVLYVWQCNGLYCQ